MSDPETAVDVNDLVHIIGLKEIELILLKKRLKAAEERIGFLMAKQPQETPDG